MQLYVYALVPLNVPSHALGAGIADEPLTVVSLGAIAAVVGEVDDRPSFSPVSLQAHEDVQRRIAAASDALLPLGFGATVGDIEELKEGIAPRAQALALTLEQTRGCDQMTLRVDAASDDLTTITRSLRPVVRVEKIERSDRPRLVTTLFHLVERSRIPEYRTRVEELSASLAPKRFDVTGPWAPYAFTELG